MFSDYTVLDFETSGLSPITDYPIEVAMLRVRNKQVVGSEAFFIKPHARFQISTQSQRLTGITQEDIEAGVTPEEAFARICAFIGEDTVICHYTKFDMGFLMSLARRCSTTLKVPTYCTLAIARKAFPLLATHKLAHLAKEFGLSTPQHRALADCTTAHELLQLCATKLDKRPSRKYYDFSFVPKDRYGSATSSVAPLAPMPTATSQNTPRPQDPLTEWTEAKRLEKVNGRIKKSAFFLCMLATYWSVAQALSGEISQGEFLGLILAISTIYVVVRLMT